MTTGEKIKNARLLARMTQKQLATACGMADSAIRKYESGRQTPKAATLKRIADALGLPITELLSDIELAGNEAQVEMKSSGDELIRERQYLEEELSPYTIFLNEASKKTLKEFAAFLSTKSDNLKKESNFKLTDEGQIGRCTIADMFRAWDDAAKSVSKSFADIIDICDGSLENYEKAHNGDTN